MTDSGSEPGSDAPSAPPGWYPVDGGIQRYWDGSRWTEHTAPVVGGLGGPATHPGGGHPGGSNLSDDRTLGLLTHLSGLVAGFLLVGFIGPLIIWLLKKDQSPFIDHHGKEALNFQLTLLLAYIVAFAAIFALIGFLLLPILFVISIVLPILAAVAANRGEHYRYPLTLRIIK